MASTGLAVLGGPLSYTKLFAMLLAIGVANHPWSHLVAGHDGRSPHGPPLVVGLALLGASELLGPDQTGPALARTVLLNGAVTALLWGSGGARAAAP